ncbi:MAG: UDP-3-O-[3-hydroxymyristoyl] N-acetylglucosamine deacetylase [Alphaproteobacteria bacterium]|nr:UDP-3-O-[3-hydroxymyristoyl] N-acetylglucosamine deacetylase [Alphaproteobacteria bacterium]
MIRVVESGVRGTVASPSAFSGIGLHTGAPVMATVRPAAAHSGIWFKRVDVPYASPIAGRISAVRETRLGTVIGETAPVRTIEHLMAALSIAGIDDAFVEVDGPELPIMDGSARDFLTGLRDSGVHGQGVARRAAMPLAPWAIEDRGRSIRWEPADVDSIEVSIEFEDAAIGSQSVFLDLANGDALATVAAARTFCRRSDIDAMHAAGLALGGSLHNAIVVDGDRILNPEGLRAPSEFAYHKALDLIGDLALFGAPLRGRISALRPGHDLNVAFVREVAERAAGCGFDPFEQAD